MKNDQLYLCNKAAGECLDHCAHGQPHKHRGGEDCGKMICIYTNQRVECKRVKKGKP